MKKLLLLLTLACSVTLNAQEESSNKKKPTLDQSVVPASAKTSFVQENPEAQPTWIMDGKNYKAEYVDEANVAHARVYDASGSIMWRDDEMSSYPTPISDYYTKTYPGEGYMIWSHIDNNGVTTYYAFHNSETLWFDKDGKLLNPKKGKTKPNDGIKIK